MWGKGLSEFGATSVVGAGLMCMLADVPSTACVRRTLVSTCATQCRGPRTCVMLVISSVASGLLINGHTRVLSCVSRGIIIRCSTKMPVFTHSHLLGASVHRHLHNPLLFVSYSAVVANSLRRTSS